MNPADFKKQTAGDDSGRPVLTLRGDWTLAALPEAFAGFEARLKQAVSDAGGSREAIVWDLSAVDRIDSVGALLLWRVWGNVWPSRLDMDAEQRRVVEKTVQAARQEVPVIPRFRPSPVEMLGLLSLKGCRHLLGLVVLLGRLALDKFYLLRHPGQIPLREFSATIFKAGVQALPVTALVGFLIGVVLSYLSSLQLRAYGADVFIINILGISIIRELGPVLVAVLIAGRSGSAMTAQIGVMRVTEEIDALVTMGISPTLRLVLPKVAALALTTPLLVVWCSSAALLGGMVSANLQLDLSYRFFIDTLPRVVPSANLLIGLSKGVIFGVLIGVIACYFGLRVKPNTESLSAKTTTSVVTSITLVILADAVFAILTREVGMP